MGTHASLLGATAPQCTGGSVLATHASYIPATAVGCSGGSTLSTHASNLGGAAPFQVGDYPAAPAASTPPPAAPVAAAVEVAAPVPIPSAGGDYLSAMGGGSGGASPPKSYAPGGASGLHVAGKTLGGWSP